MSKKTLDAIKRRESHMASRITAKAQKEAKKAAKEAKPSGPTQG